MARKKLKVIHVPEKPEDEKFKSLDGWRTDSFWNEEEQTDPRRCGAGS